jgi:hypothetical protein
MPSVELHTVGNPNLPQGFLGEVGEVYEPGGGAGGRAPHSANPRLLPILTSDVVVQPRARDVALAADSCGAEKRGAEDEKRAGLIVLLPGSFRHRRSIIPAERP